MDDSNSSNNISELNNANIQLSHSHKLSKDFIPEDDYFQGSINSETSELAIEELRKKMNLNISKSKTTNSSIKICNFSMNSVYSKKDFEIIGFLGKGTYAQVVKALSIKTNEIVALKIVDKPFIENHQKLYQIYSEYEVLSIVDHPNIIKIIGMFEENDKIYTILEYCSAGDFLEFIKNNTPLNYETAQYFIAKIVLVLEYLHNMGVVHRDIKPGNIILDENINLKLIDFNTAKIQGMYFDKIKMKFIHNINIEDVLHFDDYYQPSTFVGTAEYVSPEALFDQETGPESDLWALGCLIYQLFTGSSLFKEKTEYLTFRKILDLDKTKIYFPEYINNEVKDLVTSLLVHSPKERLGANLQYHLLKEHPFFKGITWKLIDKMEIPLKKFLKVKFSINKISINKEESKSISSDKKSKERRNY